MMQEFMPAVRPMGADFIRSQVNRPTGSVVAPPQSPTTLLRPVPTTGQVPHPLGSGVLPHQSLLTSAPRGAVVLEGDYRATRMLPAVASQRQGLGAMRAPVEMDRSDDQEVSFTGLMLDDNAMAEDQREVEHNPLQGLDGLEGCSLTSLGSALSRRRTVVTPTRTQLALWCQVRGGRTMKSVTVDVVERLYSVDPLRSPSSTQSHL